MSYDHQKQDAMQEALLATRHDTVTLREDAARSFAITAGYPDVCGKSLTAKAVMVSACCTHAVELP
eukprot:56587-Eustigmatos_ZCMA.PRE.1